MHTIRLNISDSIYQKVIRFLGNFNPDEIQVIQENRNFLSIQQYLQDELNKVEEGTAEYINLEQLNHDLESTIKQYED
ncbi:MAG: hypothetical protein JXA23_11850 [Bacteroidales bacterium]|nr:hypothetical protein [Bacteroidales bacterium]